MPTAPAYRRNPHAGRTRRDHRQYDRERRSASHRFYDSRAWRELRRACLAHPLYQACRRCGAERTRKNFIVIDHIKPRELRPDLALVQTNLQPLCRPCHERYGARVDRPATLRDLPDPMPAIIEDYTL